MHTPHSVLKFISQFGLKAIFSHDILTPEYGSSIWDPYLQKDINCIEKNQRQGARFIKKDYRSHEDDCVIDILRNLILPSLQQRREVNKLVFLLKEAEGMVSAINSEDYLEPREKRRIKAKQLIDYQWTNIVEKNVTTNSRCFIVDNI